MHLPKLYPIVDEELLSRRGCDLKAFAEHLKAAGVELLQYRDKSGSPQQILRNAAVLREVFSGSNRLIMNDRADLSVLAACDGVHVGQDDLSPEDARRVIGANKWIGLSTHSDEQVRAAHLGPATYVAVGPVFSTGTKLDAEPVIGLDGVRRARALTTKPIVAIGGITRANAPSVIEAGADSVAVISSLFIEGETPEAVARDFLRVLR